MNLASIACTTIVHLELGCANEIEEVDRAVDNLVKSGKLLGITSRRESMPLVGGPRPYSEYGKRSRLHPVRWRF